MDMMKNTHLLLGNDKECLKKYLQSKNMNYYEFPEDQISEGFNIIQTENTLFWFDCLDILYAIHMDFHNYCSNKDLSIYINNTAINSRGFGRKVVEFLQQYGNLYGSSQFHDEDLGEYRLVTYMIKGGVSYMLNIDNSDTIFGLAVQYDGYSPYQYKKGISINTFLKDKNNHSQNL